MSRDYAERSYTKRDVVGYRCDGCKRYEPAGEPNAWGNASAPAGWHDFSSSHSEWGNDSEESYDKHDVCSGACYLKVVRELVEDRWRDYPTLRVDDKDRVFLESLLACFPNRRGAE